MLANERWSAAALVVIGLSACGGTSGNCDDLSSVIPADLAGTTVVDMADATVDLARASGDLARTVVDTGNMADAIVDMAHAADDDMAHAADLARPSGDLATQSPVIVTASPLHAGVVGQAYSGTLIAAGGTAPYTWSVTSGALPDGLSLDESFGFLTGTPTAANSFSFSVAVTDARNVSTVKSFSLAVMVFASQVSTLAGGARGGFYDGPTPGPNDAILGNAGNVVRDAAGNLYVTDTSYNRVWKITPAASVSVFAGNGSAGFVDGTGGANGSAEFYDPVGLVMDAAGNLYVGDTNNNSIRKIDPAGNVTTFSGNGSAGFVDGTGGRGGTAQFIQPCQLAIDGSGNLYLADNGNHRIRKVDSSGNVTTVAGNGTPGYSDGTGGASGTAEFHNPYGIARDSGGNLYVGDYGNFRVRKIDTSGHVSSVTGNGSYGDVDGTGGLSGSAEFSGTPQVIFDGSGNLWVADSEYDGAIRRVDASGNVSTLHTSVPVPYPNGFTFDSAGNIYAVSGGEAVEVDPLGNVTVLYGAWGALSTPQAITLDGAGNVYVADSNNNSIRKVSASGYVSTVAGNSTQGHVDGTGGATGTAEFYSPLSLVRDSSGNIYVADTGNNVIRKISPSGDVTTLAGTGSTGYNDGPGSSAEFTSPEGLALDSAGILYVADTGNNVIRKIDTVSGQVSTFSGEGDFGDDNGDASSAEFYYPVGLAFDHSGNLYVADVGNNQIRRIDHAGSVVTIAGDGAAGFQDGTAGPLGTAELNGPTGVSVDDSGHVYVADNNNNAIRVINLAAGTVTTLSGGTSGFADGPAAVAQFNSPTDVKADSAGHVYVADGGRIRIITVP